MGLAAGRLGAATMPCVFLWVVNVQHRVWSNGSVRGGNGAGAGSIGTLHFNKHDRAQRMAAACMYDVVIYQEQLQHNIF
jgi:hypothetical protein